MTTMHIGSRPIGPGHPTYVIAEIGSNHGRDYNQALRHIDAAIEAGADAVKFQTYSAKNLYSKRTPRFTYLTEQGDSRDTWDIIHDAELPQEWQKSLFDYATSKGIHWLSTPTDREGVDELDAIGVPAFKISSYEAVDLPFVQYVASKGKPLIISTGMCALKEIGEIEWACRKVINYYANKVAFLQCTSLYPAPYHLANLRAMQTIAEETAPYPWQPAVVGLSDHTTGIHIPVAAVALGAYIIEKHFTLDRNLPGPDHPHSLEPHEFARMVAQIRDVEVALGDGCKIGPAPEEQEMFLKARRSVVAACNIPAGATITADMVTSKRPGYGIPAKDISQVIGKVAKVDIPEDEILTWEMVG